MQGRQEKTTVSVAPGRPGYPRPTNPTTSSSNSCSGKPSDISGISPTPIAALHATAAIPKSTEGLDTVVTGGSGFGVMAIIVAAERKWITRQEAVERLVKMTGFLLSADSFHGVLPHMLNGATGKPFHFTRKDDGGDLVETAYLLVGLLCARQYFDRDDAAERGLRSSITQLWEESRVELAYARRHECPLLALEPK